MPPLICGWIGLDKMGVEPLVLVGTWGLIKSAFPGVPSGKPPKIRLSLHGKSDSWSKSGAERDIHRPPQPLATPGKNNSDSC